MSPCGDHQHAGSTLVLVLCCPLEQPRAQRMLLTAYQEAAFYFLLCERSLILCLSYSWSLPYWTSWVSEVAQSCPTLCHPMDCSPPGSSVHGILQARVLEWVAISFSRGSSQPRDWTQVSSIAGRCFNLWTTREAPLDIIQHAYLEENQISDFHW